MKSRSNCGWCSRFKREVGPQCEREGWEVTEENAGGSVPRFVITVGNRSSDEITGFIDFDRVKKEVAKLK